MMRIVSLNTITTLFISLALIHCSSKPDTSPSTSDENPLVVFLVRHGEKVDHSDDAQLSDAGIERAILLAKILRSAEIEYVHSSDFARTRDTAAPTATEYDLDIEIYDHQNLPALVEKIRDMGGRHLVVGHSTTTPAMVGLMGGQPGPTIDDENEYDRLYIVTIGNDGNANSILIRYGKAYFPQVN